MKFSLTPLAIADVVLIGQPHFADSRGGLDVTFEAAAFRQLGLPEFVLDIQAVSSRAGTIRGLHFQRPPFAQAKLVRVVAGAILDVAVDLREGSPTQGKWVSARLSPDAGQLFVPRGFAHGYATLADDTVVVYRCDAPYAPEAEGGIHFADEALGIDWPVAADRAILSDRDRMLPSLSVAMQPAARVPA